MAPNACSAMADMPIKTPVRPAQIIHFHYGPAQDRFMTDHMTEVLHDESHGDLRIEALPVPRQDHNEDAVGLPAAPSV